MQTTIENHFRKLALQALGENPSLSYVSVCSRCDAPGGVSICGWLALDENHLASLRKIGTHVFSAAELTAHFHATA